MNRGGKRKTCEVIANDIVNNWLWNTGLQGVEVDALKIEIINAIKKERQKNTNGVFLPTMTQMVNAAFDKHGNSDLSGAFQDGCAWFRNMVRELN